MFQRKRKRKSYADADDQVFNDNGFGYENSSAGQWSPMSNHAQVPTISARAFVSPPVYGTGNMVHEAYPANYPMHAMSTPQNAYPWQEAAEYASYYPYSNEDRSTVSGNNFEYPQTSVPRPHSAYYDRAMPSAQSAVMSNGAQQHQDTFRPFDKPDARD